MPFSVSFAPSVSWGPVCCVQVRWRKLAGNEDPSKNLQESTEDRPERRLRVDSGVEAFGRNAPDNFGFGARSDGVQVWKTQKEEEENRRSRKGSADSPSADAKRSRRSIRLGTKQRTSQRALGGKRKGIECGKEDGKGGQWETGTRGEEEYREVEKEDCKEICGPNWTQTSSWT